MTCHRSRAVLLLGLLLGAACVVEPVPPLLPPDAGTTDAAGTTGAGGAAGGGGQGGALVSCPDTHVCASPAPTGWTGPVVVAMGPTPPTPPACPSDYPELLLDAGHDLIKPPAECTCECGPPAAECNPIEFTWHDMSCGDISGYEAFNQPPGTCTPTSKAGTLIAAHIGTKPTGACTPKGTTTLPPIGFAESTRACGGAEDHGGCEGEAACLPRAPDPFGKLCIFREGYDQCPTIYWKLKYVQVGFSDSRGCTVCKCGMPNTTPCASMIQAYSDAACTAPEGQPFPNDAFMCFPGPAYFKYDPPTPTSSCKPGPALPIGGASPGQGYTVCCMP